MARRNHVDVSSVTKTKTFLSRQNRFCLDKNVLALVIEILAPDDNANKTNKSSFRRSINLYEKPIMQGTRTPVKTGTSRNSDVGIAYKNSFLSRQKRIPPRDLYL